jgi:hypothetical protein
MTDQVRLEYNAEVIRLATVLQSVPVAAIAFAMHETADRTLSWSLAPITIAVVVWGAGFAAGIENSRTRAKAYKQAILEKALRACGDEAAAAQANSDFGKSNARLHWTHGVSVWTILAGALLYAGGHGWHLMEQTRPPKPQTHALPHQDRTRGDRRPVAAPAAPAGEAVASGTGLGGR